MNDMTHRAANAYTQVDLTSSVGSASPEKLILMLLDGAMNAVQIAKLHMEERNISEKGMNISKAISILGELSGSLNHEVGGEIADNLGRLYDYMTRRLVHANLKNDMPALDEVKRLLSVLRDGWATMSSKQNSTDPDGAGVVSATHPER